MSLRETTGAYFNVQLITICAVVISKWQLLYCPLADHHALCSCKSCLKYALRETISWDNVEKKPWGTYQNISQAGEFDIDGNVLLDKVTRVCNFVSQERQKNRMKTMLQ